MQTVLGEKTMIPQGIVFWEERSSQHHFILDSGASCCHRLGEVVVHREELVGDLEKNLYIDPFFKREREREREAQNCVKNNTEESFILVSVLDTVKKRKKMNMRKLKKDP